MTAKTWLTPDEQRAWRGLIEMSTRLRGRVGRQLRLETGLSDADYAVLVLLSETPDGRLRPFELGRTLEWEKSRLSHHLARMAERGLVRRVPCKSDSRGAWIVLTAAGRRAIEAAAPRHVEHVRQSFVEALSPEQLEALAGISESVLAHLLAQPEPGCQEEC